jgi:hypothetical protein
MLGVMVTWCLGFLQAWSKVFQCFNKQGEDATAMFSEIVENLQQLMELITKNQSHT